MLVRILPRRWHDPTLPWNQTAQETRGGHCQPCLYDRFNVTRKVRWLSPPNRSSRGSRREGNDVRT